MRQAKTTGVQFVLIAGAFIGTFSLGYHSSAKADPASKVYTPAVVQGEWELEFRGGYQRWRNQDGNRERQLVGDVGYAFTSWWKSELATGYTKLPGESWVHDETEWENIFALTEPGRYWLDSALFAEYARDHAGHRNLLEIGPLLQKDIGSVQANLNFLFVREFASSAEPGAGIEYAAQLKWRGNPLFEPGVQAFGGIGRTNQFGRNTNHRLGPAFFGQMRAGDRQKLRYDAAVLFGLNNNSADTTIRCTLEYEFY